MKKIGITGQSGFIGSHLLNNIKLFKNEFEIIHFEKEFFNDINLLDDFVKKCDVIVHLAAINRHEDQIFLHDKNIELCELLKNSLDRVHSKAHLLISSSTQEERNNNYGNAKKAGRELLYNWSVKNNTVFTGLIIPNVFGPFGKPFYNSVIATFCHQLNNNEVPKIEIDAEINLIYVQELVEEILKAIRENINSQIHKINHTKSIKVSSILNLLLNFKEKYLNFGEIPILKDDFELNLFNTFRCYLDFDKHYPFKLNKHTDERGYFVEIIRLGIGGQVSFSTTVPQITRGNHFHTKKIERFTVIKGKALIQLRKIDSNTVHNFELDGDEPSFVDMPIWYTHNIKNIGTETLYTIFWINEPFDPNNPDTFFEIV